MISPNSLQISKNWWIQFPYHLRLITKIRFYAAFGAGGVIYLTSLIFNSIGLSATDIGLGFTISAIIGTVTRLVTGNYLNKTGKIQFPIVTSSILSIVASLCLIFSRDTFLYIIGQSFVGAAAGIYWPAAEFGVPYFCHPIETRKAYALVRSSEALGIFLGVFLGGYMTNFLYSKSIFINDVLCMLVITNLISRNSSSIKRNLENFQKKLVDPINQGQLKWNKNSTIIILSILLITTSLALIQVTLPLDLVKGGVFRKALSKEIISLIISIQLILLLFLQWPVGSWISKKERLFGLKFSLINFSFASFLLFISSYLNIPAFYLISLALILVSLGTASFLPTSTDVVFRIAPSNKKGFALALLSQCFAMGYFFGPFISGRILDLFGYASIIWLSISCCCFIAFTILFKRLF
ncbi:putative multidrug efflux transporter [Prochlorococcus marinus str. MIT 9321]|uniref:Putative multidrug efflux transporter n=1 Tax=Prochlorococcus marinus str. MIT 9401 TaxID=167551 RepID=A0A0A2BD39_PROMR|nr:MFS transporter [Prochlorococcus marinus]KGG06007.1 putative multidrug efflux transporter [Prochlorococcus marinus str. MIT 9321]KGG06863.1 putative multidrug efflux transporter [Prochlorococcus marinus str. MIT 9322]KGG11037.1 putative multidrug efflux transporter [Prochlorococcus marinus str. MIT 9401]